MHNTQPWVIELHERTVLLFERWDVTLSLHDPTGRDRLLSCGAALTNLELAVRHLGWETGTVLYSDPAHPYQAATVEAVCRRAPTQTEQELYDAIAQRHGQRFATQPVGRRGQAELEHRGAEIASLRMAGTMIALVPAFVCAEEDWLTLAGRLR